MGVYTYTLRTKTQAVELPGGAIVDANIMAYLCRSNDHDTFMLYPGDYGYKTAMALNAQIEACQQRWWRKGPVFIIHEGAKQGWEIYRAESAAKAAVWYDCDSMTMTEGVTLVGRLGPRVRRGRKLVWTVMTDEQAQAFDQAEEEKRQAEQLEHKRRAIIARARAHAEECARKQREAQDASLSSAGL
jgi:hypothetical protein